MNYSWSISDFEFFMKADEFADIVPDNFIFPDNSDQGFLHRQNNLIKTKWFYDAYYSARCFHWSKGQFRKLRHSSHSSGIQKK